MNDIHTKTVETYDAIARHYDDARNKFGFWATEAAELTSLLTREFEVLQTGRNVNDAPTVWLWAIVRRP